jgi:hypothetical protein
VTTLRSVRLLGRELGRLTMDRPRRRAGLPRRAGDLDAVTLGSLLGREVTGVEALDGTSGTTDRCRLQLSGRDVPLTVFVKTAATDTGTRFFGGLARLGEVEVGFYRDLRPQLALEAPQLMGAFFDARTGRFVVVLEDLVERGAGFVDTRTALTVDQVTAALSTLATLHGSTRGGPRPGWLTTNSEDVLLPLVTAILGRLGTRVRERDPSLVAHDGDRILGSYRRWAPMLDLGERCVLHGDPHPGNLYLLEDRVGLLDWQAVRLGNGIRDASYLMVLGLAVDVRRQSEKDLHDHYRAELLAAGGPDVSAHDVWRRHRQMAGYAYVSAAFTYGLGGLQGDEIADSGLRRAVAAVDDLETAAALELR